MGVWNWYWRGLWGYRGFKYAEREWKAAGERKAAREAAEAAAKRAIAEGVGPEEAARIAERAAREAVRKRGTIEMIAAKAVTEAGEKPAEKPPIWKEPGFLIALGIVIGVLMLIGKFL
jgi:hypothetical protein